VDHVSTGEVRQVRVIFSEHFQGSSISDTAGNVAKLLALMMTTSLPVHVDNTKQLGCLLTANIANLAERNVSFPVTQSSVESERSLPHHIP
jgi:hypothetical protein